MPFDEDLEWERKFEFERDLRRSTNPPRRERIEEDEPDSPYAVPDLDDDPASTYMEERLMWFRQTVRDLEKDLEYRLLIYRDSVREMDMQLTYAAFSLGETKGWGVGYNRGIDMKRNHLERQLEVLRHKRRQERRTLWHDVMEVKKRLREAMSEYARVSRTSHAMGPVQ